MKGARCAPERESDWVSKVAKHGKLDLGDGLARQDDARLAAENLQQHGDALAAFELLLEDRFET